MTLPREEPGTRLCTSCGIVLVSGQVFYRFRVQVEGDADLVDNEGQPTPGEFLEKIEAEADWKRYEDEVHWEVSGVVCSPCRGRFVGSVAPYALRVM